MFPQLNAIIVKHSKLGNWKTLKARTGSGNGNGNILPGFKMRMRMTLMNERGSLLMPQSSLCGFMHTVLAKETGRTDQHEP